VKEIIQKNLEEIKNDKLYFFLKILLTTVFAITLFLDSILKFTPGSVFDKIGEIYFENIGIKNIFIFIGTWIITFLIISLIEIFVKKIENTIYTKKERKIKNIKVFFIVFLVLIICWLPYILSYFPGGIYSDTISSINQATGEQPLNNHHPMLYTLLLKLFIEIGTKIQGLQLGIELFTIFQILLMAITFAFFVYWLYKKKIATKYLVLITLFFGLCNLIPYYAISIWKDTPFSIALFWYILFIIEIVYQDGKNIEKIKGVISYVVLALLVAFLRNNGIFIVICTTAFLLFTYRKNIIKTLKKFAIASILTIILIGTIQGPVYNHYGKSTEFVENLGVPVQQICYVVATDGNINEQQKEFINQLCPIEVIKEKYTPCLVDSIKWSGNFNHAFLAENKLEFFKVWFSMFLQNPVSYVKAYLMNTIGFWDVRQASLGDLYINPQMWLNSDECIGVKQTNYIQEITGISIRNILIPKNAVSSAVFLFIMIFGMLITGYTKRYKNLLIYLPALIVWGTIMIAVPLAFSLRYVYILVLMVPISFIIPFLKDKKEIDVMYEVEDNKDIIEEIKQKTEKKTK